MAIYIHYIHANFVISDAYRVVVFFFSFSHTKRGKIIIYLIFCGPNKKLFPLRVLIIAFWKRPELELVSGINDLNK